MTLGFAVATAPGLAAAEAPSKAAPTKREEAIGRFRRGLELYEEQDYEAALSEFRRAYDLSPNYKVLYNVGQVCFQLQDYACALRAFESYLDEGGAEVPDVRRAEVGREVDRLKLRVARLEIVTNVPGADVTVDDVSVGKTPLPGPLTVSAGKRRVVAAKEGRQSVVRTVNVPGAETVRLELTLAPQQGDVRYVERPSRWTRWSWIGVAAAGTLAAGATVTGALALDADTKLDTQRFVGAPTPEVASQQSTVRTYAVATDVLVGAAIVTLATTLVLTFMRDPATPKLDAMLSPGGASLGGRF